MKEMILDIIKQLNDLKTDLEDCKLELARCEKVLTIAQNNLDRFLKQKSEYEKQIMELIEILTRIQKEEEAE